MNRRNENKGIVYCSGPLFSPEEVFCMGKIAALLESAGFDTFLPHRDGVEAFVLNQVNNPFINLYCFKPVKKIINRAIFALDVFQIIERCDYFVFNMNGRVPDEGGVVELAIAMATGKPIIIYKDDCRGEFLEKDHYILKRAFYNNTVNDIEEIPEKLQILIDNINPVHGRKEASFLNGLPFEVKKTVACGRKTWFALNKIQFIKPENVMQNI